VQSAHAWPSGGAEAVVAGAEGETADERKHLRDALGTTQPATPREYSFSLR
jgi:hypothetical protein